MRAWCGTARRLGPDADALFRRRAVVLARLEKIAKDSAGPGRLIHSNPHMEDDGDDSNLVQRASQGDADAFASLFRRYHPMIFAFAYRLCLDPADAQEIAQETFIKAARALADVRDLVSCKGWLYRIARNTAIDLGRAGARRERLAAQVFEGRPGDERPGDFAFVAEALAGLSADLREAIVLVYYEEMNHAQAARVLGCAEATVSWRVHMAKRKLKKLLKP
jgi:RNA polymerase sigma-70 factor (ECF subfamily)